MLSWEDQSKDEEVKILPQAWKFMVELGGLTYQDKITEGHEYL